MFKTFKTAVFAAMFAVVSFSAQAEGTTGNSFDFTVQGTVPAYCEAINNSLAPVETIDLEDTSAQTLGSVTYKCNLPEGFTRTISSANGGTLNGGSTSIPYEVSSGGGSGLGFSPEQLTAPKVTSLSGSGAFANGQTGSFKVVVPSGPGNALAGTVSDVITIGVAGN